MTLLSKTNNDIADNEKLIRFWYGLSFKERKSDRGQALYSLINSVIDNYKAYDTAKKMAFDIANEIEESGEYYNE